MQTGKKLCNSNNMNNRNQLIRRLLSGLTDSELENLVRVREKVRPIPAPRRQREACPIPVPRRRQQQEPRRSVQKLIRHFEANPIYVSKQHNEDVLNVLQKMRETLCSNQDF